MKIERLKQKLFRLEKYVKIVKELAPDCEKKI